MAKRMTEFYQKEVTGQFTGPIKIGSSAEYITMEDTDSAETLKDFSGRVGDPSNLYNNVDKEKDQQKDLVTTVNELTAIVAAGAKMQDKSIQQSKLKDIKIVDSTASYPAITDGPLGNILGKIKKFLNDLKNNKVSKTGDTMTSSLSIKGGYILASRDDSWCYLEAKGAGETRARLMSTQNGDSGLYSAKIINNSTIGRWLVKHFWNTEKTIIPTLSFDENFGIVGKIGDSTVTAIGVRYSNAIADTNVRYCFIKQLGNTIFMTMSIAYTTTDGTIPTGTTLFTVPKIYAPTSTQRLPAFFAFKSSTTPHGAMISIDSNGAIQQNHSSSTNSIYCVGMWERK